MRTDRRAFLGSGLVVLLGGMSAVGRAAAARPTVTVYKSPG